MVRCMSLRSLRSCGGETWTVGVEGARGAKEEGGAKPPRWGLRCVEWPAGPVVLGTMAPKGCVVVIGEVRVDVESATVVILQTLIELVGELVYIRLIPEIGRASCRERV